MPEEERTEERLAKEAQVLLGGGTASTARTIGFASYYILSRPELRNKLEAELKEPMANWPQKVPTWAELEKLPLLQAIIKESLRYADEQANEEMLLTYMCVHRLSYGVMHRLPRVFPDQPIQYKDYVIPIGVRQSDHLLCLLIFVTNHALPIGSRGHVRIFDALRPSGIPESRRVYTRTVDS